MRPHYTTFRVKSRNSWRFPGGSSAVSWRADGKLDVEAEPRKGSVSRRQQGRAYYGRMMEGTTCIGLRPLPFKGATALSSRYGNAALRPPRCPGEREEQRQAAAR
jgi:hypothetical protein